MLRDGPKAVQAKHLLGEAFRAGWAAKVASGNGYEEGTGRDDTSPKARMARTMQHYVDHFEEIPVVVLACLVRYRDVHYTEGASIYPVCQNLLLAARALGFGGALTGWHAFVEEELRALLAVPDGVALSATITLGRPQGHHGPVRRRRSVSSSTTTVGRGLRRGRSTRPTPASPPQARRSAKSVSFSAWPPNCSRIAARILLANSEASRDSKRS